MSNSIQATATVVAAMVKASNSSLIEVTQMIEFVHEAFKKLEAKKAIGVTESHLICLIDNKPVKQLKAYVRRKYGYTNFQDYLREYNLPPDYPAVAASTSQLHAENAKKTKLGVRKS